VWRAEGTSLQQQESLHGPDQAERRLQVLPQGSSWQQQESLPEVVQKADAFAQEQPGALVVGAGVVVVLLVTMMRQVEEGVMLELLAGAVKDKAKGGVLVLPGLVVVLPLWLLLLLVQQWLGLTVVVLLWSLLLLVWQRLGLVVVVLLLWLLSMLALQWIGGWQGLGCRLTTQG